jgi:DNA (cytosine-5)-methyltransferase 1
VRRPTVISLFSGAGGLDYGLEAAGFDVAVALEMDHDCCETLRANRPWDVIEKNVFDLRPGELLKTAGVKQGEADLLVGGPPCQPFSKSGYWARGDALRLDDPRANTLSAYLGVLREALPRAFLLENVEGLAYSGKDEGMRLLLRSLETINKACGTNYTARPQVVNAADYGVPQLRQRVFLIGSRDGTEFRVPAPTHSDGTGGLPRHRTAWEALWNVVPTPHEDLTVRGKWARLLPAIPEGENYLFHTPPNEKRGGTPLFGWRRRYWSFLLKLAKDRPSWTITAQPGPAIGPFHWENRRLSMRELCRLQTFPDDVQILGSRTSVQKQVGNAVPSLLAEVLGREIRTQLLGLPALPRAPHLAVATGAPLTPPPTHRAPVPADMLKLAGKHKPHPGTGKGNGARARQRLAG